MGREMDDGLHLMLTQRGRQRRRVEQVALHEDRGRMDGGAVALDQVVVDDHAIAALGSLSTVTLPM